MKVLLTLIISFASLAIMAQEKPVSLKYAQQFLGMVQTGQSTVEMETELARYDAAALQKELNTDELRKAFWINIYNAAVQNALSKNVAAYSNPKKFLKRKFITVAGNSISPNDIQNTVLRNGAAGKMVAGNFAKQFAVEKFDNRIHFALNNGAASAGAIYNYDPVLINIQLDAATKNYIKANVQMDEEGEEVFVPKWFDWYKADFGGKEGLLHLFRQYEVVFMNVTPRFEWKQYDWSPAFKNFAAATTEK